MDETIGTRPHQVRKNIDMGPYLEDQYYRGILCSAKFEGMTPKQMHTAFETAMAEAGLPGRAKFNLQPPSRMFMLKQQRRKWWGIDV